MWRILHPPVAYVMKFEDLILKEPGLVSCLPVQIGLSVILTWNLSVSIFIVSPEKQKDVDAKVVLHCLLLRGGLLHVCWRQMMRCPGSDDTAWRFAWTCLVLLSDDRCRKSQNCKCALSLSASLPWQQGEEHLRLCFCRNTAMFRLSIHVVSEVMKLTRCPWWCQVSAMFNWSSRITQLK